MSLSNMLSTEASELLYAAGWRMETAPFHGPRAILEKLGDDDSYYATIRAKADSPSGATYSWHWDVWNWHTGMCVASGVLDEALLAAGAVANWLSE